MGKIIFHEFHTAKRYKKDDMTKLADEGVNKKDFMEQVAYEVTSTQNSII